MLASAAFRVFVAALVLLGFLRTANAIDPPVVSIAADIYCPYNCAAGTDTPGFAVELAEEAFKTLGWSVDYREMGWIDAVDAATVGDIDGVIAAYPDDAPGLVLPKTPILGTNVGFALPQGDPWRYRTIDDLRGRRIGLIVGYGYGEPFDSLLPTLPDDALTWVHGETAMTDLLDLLSRGQIDLVFDDEYVLRWKLTADIYHGLRMAPDIVAGDPVYFAFSNSPRGQAIAAAFDAAAPALAADGVVRALARRYGLE